MDFFTADWHLDHENIIRFSKRPFTDTEEMGRTIIRNLNEAVGPDDRLFMLGDVTAGRTDCYDRWLNQITCRNRFLFPGNHDKDLKALAKYFEFLPIPYGYHVYRERDQVTILHHHAMRVWPRAHHGAWHLYGHSHGNLPNLPGAAAFDIGVDCWNFKPLSYAQVCAEMKRRIASGPKYVVDHHGADDEAR